MQNIYLHKVAQTIKVMTSNDIIYFPITALFMSFNKLYIIQTKITH